jgi:hypothetical protein
MIAGINKPQWLLIIPALLIVLVVNTMGMWQQFQIYKARQQAWPEIYTDFACSIPWMKIILEGIVVTIFLMVFAWLLVFLSRRAFFQKLPSRLRYGSELLIALLAGATFMVTSILFSDGWIQYFWCGPMAGLSKSSLVLYLSPRLVLPATSVLIFWAMYLSNSQEKSAFVVA